MIHVVMTTYVPKHAEERAAYAARSVTSLVTHLKANDQFTLIAADDGSTSYKHLGVMKEAAEAGGWGFDASVGPHVGIGGSLNRALETIDHPNILWLYTTDDWVLTADLDLTTPLWLIEHMRYSLVRLGPIHPNLRCKTSFEAEHGWWLDLDPDGGGFVFATRPFLATVGYWQNYGRFIERADAYAVEADYARRVALGGGLSLKHAAVVDQGLHGPWSHIGDVEVGDRFVEHDDD